MNATTMIVERKGDEQPHYMKPNEDCIGRPTAPYWRQFLFCNDGTCVSGVGETPLLAMEDASKQRNNREAFISCEPRAKVLSLISKGCRGTQEQNDLNKALAELLLLVCDEVEELKKQQPNNPNG